MRSTHLNFIVAMFAFTWGVAGSLATTAIAAPIAGQNIGHAQTSEPAQYRPGRSLSYDELAYYCSLGSQTPYSLRQRCRDEGLGGPRRHRGGDRGRYGYDELAYKCSLGSQTPVSMRSACRRAGLGGW